MRSPGREKVTHRFYSRLLNSALLYPPVEQEELAKYIPNSALFQLRSHHGHDAFLMDGDMDALNDPLVTFGNGWEMGNGRRLGMVGQRGQIYAKNYH
jgi:homoserine O-acetyltransferase